MRSKLALLSLCASFSGLQAQTPTAAPGTPNYVPAAAVDITQITPQSLSTTLSGVVLSMPPGGADSSEIFLNPTFGLAQSGNGNGNGGPAGNGNPHSAGTGAPGLMTVPTFTGEWFAQAGPSSTGTKLWRYAMMGNDPALGGTTRIPAKIDEVSLQLLKADGSVFKDVSYSSFETPTLQSPNFQNTSYSSSPNPTQFEDAVHRAQFFSTMANNPPWHTMLDATVVNRATITVPYFVNVRLSNGNVVQARSYFTGTAADGSTFVLMLNLLFNFFFDNEVVNDINTGCLPRTPSTSPLSLTRSCFRST